MKLLPFFIRIRMVGGGWWMPTLWIPVVLLWPILIILMFLIFVIGLLAIAVIEARSTKRYLQLFGGIYTTLCELRGTRIDVESPDGQVFVAID